MYMYGGEVKCIQGLEEKPGGKKPFVRPGCR